MFESLIDRSTVIQSDRIFPESYLNPAMPNQFRLKRYVPVSYWAVVVLVSIVGTLITFRLVDEMGMSLVTATVTFSIVLLGLFSWWYVSEGTLAMHSIKTTKKLFYWAAILLTFALGTAAGDLLAEGTGLGYAVSALLFGSVIALIAIAYYRLGMNGVLTFWLAYILCCHNYCGNRSFRFNGSLPWIGLRSGISDSDSLSSDYSCYLVLSRLRRIRGA